MVGDYARFDFGRSYFRDQLGHRPRPPRSCRSRSRSALWTTLLTYLISIPLGIRKAVRDGTPFDVWTSGVIIVGYAVPASCSRVLLVVLFAGGSYLQWFPLRGLVSDDSGACLVGKVAGLSLAHRAADHGAGDRRRSPRLTMLTKNSFLEEINKQYVLTARAKGLTERPRPLRPRLPQRDADRDRRLSRAPSSACCSPARC